jgi:hypothetical protein
MEAGCLPVDVDINDPFRRLDWHWWCATQVVADGKRGSPYRHDAETIVLIKFWREEKRRGDRTGSRAVSEWWPLDEVVALHQEGGLKCAEIQALILAGQDDKMIAERCGAAPEIVDWYERTFFNVRDRLAAARDWVVYTAIGYGMAVYGGTVSPRSRSCGSYPVANRIFDSWRDSSLPSPA